MKTFYKVILSILLFTTMGGVTYGADFTVKVPTTDAFGGLHPPIKAGSSFIFQLTVKNNTSLSYVVSIDKDAMGAVKSWISIDFTSQTITPGQTKSYILTVNVPSSASDMDYPLPLSFNAYDPSNNNNPFIYFTQTIIVDKSNPQTPAFSISPKSSEVYVYSWSSFDSRSIGYTNKNQSSGLNGIKDYTIVLKRADNSVVETKTISATGNTYYTFKTNITSNTDYKVNVTAADLAGNSSSAEVPTRTAPGPPTLSISKTSFCYITLTWSAPSGAVKYEVWDVTNTTYVLKVTTTGTTYTVNGLLAGTPYKFYVRALNNLNTKSDPSNTLNTSTLTVPIPSISGNKAVCSSGATFLVSNLPSECSLLWDKGPNLSLYSSSGNSATFKATGSSASWIKATINSGCGTSSANYLVDAGSPKPGPITIQFDAPPGRFTASIDGLVSATSYKWYLDGVLKFNALEDVVIFQRQIGNCGHVYYVDVSLVNACGVSPIRHAEVSEPPCYKSFIIYPNPANSEISISQNEDLSLLGSESIQSEITMIGSIKIIDNFGNTYYYEKYDSEIREAVVNISALQAGSYLIIINSETNKESYPFIKN